jgi:hypothetical protein
MREEQAGHHALIRMTFDSTFCSRIDKQRVRNTSGVFQDNDIDFLDPSQPWHRPEFWVPPVLHDAWNEPLARFTTFWLAAFTFWIAYDLCRRRRPRLPHAVLFLIPLGHIMVILAGTPFFRYTEPGLWALLLLALTFRLQRLCANGMSTAGKVLLGLWCGSLISFLGMISADDRSFFPTQDWWAPPPVPETTTVTTD